MDAAKEPPVAPTPSYAKLAAALAKAQGAFTVPTKGHTAKVRMKNGGEYSYRYSTLDDLIAATRPALASNGLAVMQDVEVGPTHVSVWTVLLHESGESWRSGAVALAIGGDGRPQDVGSAITYARRYSMGAALNVAADEDDDGAVAQEAPPRDRRSERPREAPRHAAPPAQPGPDDPITHEQRRRLVAEADEVGWSKDDIKALLGKFGYASSKDIKGKDYQAVLEALQTGSLPESETPAHAPMDDAVFGEPVPF